MRPQPTILYCTPEGRERSPPSPPHTDTKWQELGEVAHVLTFSPRRSPHNISALVCPDVHICPLPCASTLTKSPCRTKLTRKHTLSVTTPHKGRASLTETVQVPWGTKSAPVPDRRAGFRTAVPWGAGWKAGLWTCGPLQQRSDTCKDTETKGLTQQGARSRCVFSKCRDPTRKEKAGRYHLGWGQGVWITSREAPLNGCVSQEMTH